MGLGISSVGIPEILPYTKSERLGVTGKYLTRHAKNGYAAVAKWQPLNYEKYPHHIISDLLQHILVAHDVSFGCVAISNVAVHA